MRPLHHSFITDTTCTLTLEIPLLLPFRNVPNEEEDVAQLIEALEDAFSKTSKHMYKDIADTLVPTVNRVKKVHRVLDETVDSEMNKGFKQLEQVCHATEDRIVNDQVELLELWKAHKVGICVFKLGLHVMASFRCVWTRSSHNLNRRTTLAKNFGRGLRIVSTRLVSALAPWKPQHLHDLSSQSCSGLLESIPRKNGTNDRAI